MNRKIRRMGMFHVYIAECGDGTYYTGYTNDLKRRLNLHSAGKGAKYTRAKRPVKLVWSKEYKYFKWAVKKEAEIKKLSHKAKEELVRIYGRTGEAD